MTKADPKIEAPAAPEIPASPAPDDPFDLAKLRLGQDYAETVGVKKLLRTVPVRKPNRQDFIRVHPDAAYRENLPAIELKEDRELYLIGGRDLASELAAEVIFVTLYTAINRQGVAFLWPVRLPNPDGKDMDWHRSAREAAAEAVHRWVRVAANMSLGGYEMIVAESVTAEPKWPDVSYQELIRIAFKDRLITDFDHPVVKRLRGLA